MRELVSFGCGALFALGPTLSGMTQPDRVIGFLDIFGAWDPSLALVMVGAIGVHLSPSMWALRRDRPVLDVTFHLPAFHDVDAPLLAGSALFGVGWGLSGYCPGPAVVAASAGSPAALVFGVGMVGGMAMWAFQQTRTPSKTVQVGEAGVVRDG